MRYLLLMLFLLCSSCIQIGHEPQPMHYYLLESMVEAPRINLDYKLIVDLELIDFPDYIDRPQIAARKDNNGIQFVDDERWAEPVQDNLMRVIRENLALMIPGLEVSVSPWENSNSNAVKVKLVINSFLGKLDGSTQLDIRWTIDDPSAQVIRGHFTDQQPIGGNYQELVVGLNNGINNLSLVLAKKLAGEQ